MLNFYNKQFNASELKSNLKKKKKKFMLFYSLLFAILILGVNVFAWFVYINYADLNLNINVARWAVSFTENDMQVYSLEFNVDAYPGMDPFTSQVHVINDGELPGNFYARVDSISLFGNDMLPSSGNTDAITKLSEFYPFKIDVNPSTYDLNPGDEIDFQIIAQWDYENEGEPKYYKIEEFHEYDPSVNYLAFNGSNVFINDEASFMVNKNNLYMSKDDADTYFGLRCANYKENTGEDCIKIGISLVVEQAS